ncbi:succinate-semialdehyde dehydrogenase [compost metagenome]
MEGALVAKYRNAGQTCVCANRVYVHDAVYDDITASRAQRQALEARVAELEAQLRDVRGR